MVREWEYQDIPTVARILHTIRAHSPWNSLPVDVSITETIKWLYTLYQDHMTHCIVSVNDAGGIVACAGGRLDEKFHPPHIRVVEEWVLWGDDKRDIVECWRAVRQWGKRRGAIVAIRGISTPQGEFSKWEKL